VFEVAVDNEDGYGEQLISIYVVGIGSAVLDWAVRKGKIDSDSHLYGVRFYLQSDTSEGHRLAAQLNRRLSCGTVDEQHIRQK